MILRQNQTIMCKIIKKNSSVYGLYDNVVGKRVR